MHRKQGYINRVFKICIDRKLERRKPLFSAIWVNQPSGDFFEEYAKIY